MERVFKIVAGMFLGIAIATLFVCGVTAIGVLGAILIEKNLAFGVGAVLILTIGAILGAVYISRTL